MADVSKIKVPNDSTIYNIRDAGAARQEQVNWNTNNGVKNMLDCIKDGYLYPYSGYGITTIVDKEAGTVTINGTLTRQLTFVLQRGSLDVNMTYKLSGCPANGNFTSGYSLVVEDTSENVYAYDEGAGVVFTPRANHLRIRIMMRPNTTFNNVVFKPMLRPAYIEDDTFEPYAMSNLELTQKVATYSREYSPSTSDYEAANITEGILTTYAAGLAGKSDGSFCVLRTYSMDTPSIGTSKRIQIAEFADGTRKTRTYNNNAWSAWV